MTEVVARVCATARDEHARRVTDVRLECGEMSGVVPDALEFCFDVCTAGTAAEGAVLHIKRVPAEWRCTACGAGVASQAECPECGSGALELVRGREFFLASVDIED